MQGITTLLNYCKNLWISRYIIISLAVQDIRNRYRRSVFGVLWSILMPLGLALIIASVYTIIWKTNIQTFLPFLLSGLTPWNFISACSSNGAMAYLSAEGYIKQLPVKIELFPVRVMLGSLIELMFGLIAFFIIVIIFNPALITINLLFVPAALIVYMVAGTAMATIAATLQTFVRDYAPLQTLLLQAFFYVTPIIFTTDIIAQRGVNFELIYKINPFYYFLQIMRDSLLGNQPDPVTWLIAIVISIALLLIAILLVQKTRKQIVFKL
jgi:ABC-type polysaccharide/polyol phosphate export permease